MKWFVGRVAGYRMIALGRSLALDSGWSDRSHYLLAKGAAPNAPAGAARWPTSWIDSSF
jgi:hypothetical protein